MKSRISSLLRPRESAKLDASRYGLVIEHVLENTLDTHKCSSSNPKLTIELCFWTKVHAFGGMDIQVQLTQNVYEKSSREAVHYTSKVSTIPGHLVYTF